MRIYVVNFVRSGYIELPKTAGRLRNAGNNSLAWSSVASATRNDGASVPSAYYLHFFGSNVNPSNGPDYRWYGFPLRCLASGRPAN